MKYLFYSFLFISFILSSCHHKSTTFTKEEIILDNGGKSIYGVLYRPDKVKKAPLVIMSHGFGGNHLFGKDYAESIAPLGYAVYCFDFCGGSNNSLSDGKTTEMSIFSEAKDLEAVMDGLRSIDGIDHDSVILVGESQGGMVSALVAAERKDEVERLILVYPAFCIKDDWVGRYPNIEDMPEEVDIWGVKLGRTFLERLYGLDVFGTISLFDGPVSIFHGDNDKVVDISYSENALKVYSKADLTVYPGEGHGFTPETRRKVIEAIKDKLR